MHTLSKSSGLSLGEILKRDLKNVPNKAAFIKCLEAHQLLRASLRALEKKFPELASNPALLSGVLQQENEGYMLHQPFPHEVVQMHNADITTTIHHQ